MGFGRVRTGGVPRWLRRVLVGVILAAPPAIGQVVADAPATQPQANVMRPADWPVAVAEPLPLLKMKPDDWAKAYPRFKHRDNQTAGFNAVSLPIIYASTAGPGEPALANAAAFLLSDDLDFSPSSFSTRHAYFVFKRDRESFARFTKAYDAESIAKFADRWHATHAVGGLIVEGPKGFVATLQIFDSSGKKVHEKEWLQPMDLFHVVGAFGIEAMKFFGDTPSDALVQHLSRARCKDPQSLVKLGKAALAPERSKEEFGLYEEILAKDPGFAEVRQWWANQRWWQDSDRPAYELEKATSLDSAITMVALHDLYLPACPNKALAADYPKWMKEATKLAGEEHPSLLLRRLADMRANKQADEALLRQALSAAAKYPNNEHLLMSLAQWYRGTLDRENKVVIKPDPYLAASLAAAALQARSLAAISHRPEHLVLAETTKRIGRHNHSAAAYFQAAEGAETEIEKLDDLYNAGVQLTQAGNYRATQAVFRTLMHRDAVKARDALKSAEYVAFASLMLDDRKSLDELLQEPVVRDSKAYPYFERFKWAMDGRPLTNKSYSKEILDPAYDAMTRINFRNLIVTESDQAMGANHFAPAARGALCRDPFERHLTIAMEHAMAGDPKLNAAAGESAAFYDTLDWLWSFDPWAVKAVRKWQARGGKPPVWKQDEAIAQIENRKVEDPIPPPWAVASAVRSAIRERRWDDAMKLIDEYDQKFAQTRIEFMGFVSVLRQKVEDERPQP